VRIPVINGTKTNSKVFNGPVSIETIRKYASDYNIMYVDGDGDGKICVFVDGDTTRIYGRMVEFDTAPENEYYSMLAGLSYIRHYHPGKWLILSDNQMVVGQLGLMWKISKQKFHDIKHEIYTILRKSDDLDIKIGWIRGKSNKASCYLKSIEFDYMPEYCVEDIICGNLYIT